MVNSDIWLKYSSIGINSSDREEILKGLKDNYKVSVWKRDNYNTLPHPSICSLRYKRIHVLQSAETLEAAIDLALLDFFDRLMICGI